MPYKNIEDRRAQVKKWREENPKRQKEIEKKAREQNAKTIKEQHEKFNALNPDKQKVYTATFNKKHPGKNVQSSRDDWLKHGDKRMAQKKVYRKNNPEISCIATAKYRSRKLKLLSTLTAKEWRLMLAAYNNKCTYCGIVSKKLAQEHVIPVSKSGPHVAGNIVPSCASCNSKKNAHMWWDVFEPLTIGV
jgi:5-methylcytosine-specific restriction endonuclease McrA